MKIALTISLLLLSCLLIAQAQFVDITADQNFRTYNSAWTYGCGVSAADYDQDGDIDLYLLSNEESANKLYENDGLGNYTEVVGALALEGRTRTALWLDINGDKLLDILITGDCSSSNLSCLDRDNIFLFQQNQNGTFNDITEGSGLLSGRSISGVFGGLAAGDYNNDGYLDIVMTQWGGDVKLYENKKDGTFEDVTTTSNIENPTRYWQPLFFDLNQDGWSDLYLTVDNSRNFFFLNNGDGTFEEMAVPINLDNSHNDMGIAIGDFDADEDFDVYITNIERDFAGDHNALLKNNLQNGSFSFTEISKDLSIDKGGWGWGTTFLDADNDGYLDLAATNGWVTDFNDQSKLWQNTGNGFEDVSDQSGFNDTLQATTLISFDMDGDGDLDMAQTLKDNPDQAIAFRLLENKLNETVEFGNYLVVKPRMTNANYWAIGSTVKIVSANGIQTRPITAGISFYGQEPAEAHFGLGDLTTVEKVIVVWPGGSSSTIADVTANQVIFINDEDALHAPSILLATVKSSSSIELAWSHMSTFENGFQIQRSLSEDFDDYFLIEVSSDQYSFVDTGLESFTYYYYRIQATDGMVSSKFGNISKAKTESDVEILAPENLSGEVKNNYLISINWVDQANNEEGYIVQRALSKDFKQIFSYDLAPNSHSFEDSNVEPHTTYYYRVQAYREDGESDFSNEIELASIILDLDESIFDVSVYPNPNTGKFQLSMPDNMNIPMDVSLFNIAGELIQSWHFSNKNALKSEIFQPATSSGVFFLKIESVKFVKTLKLSIK